MGFVAAHPPIGAPRWNATTDAPDVQQSVERGVGFLRRHQRRDGSWRAFTLFPGASSTWITAHVAYVLEEVFRATDICERAAKYLDAVGRRRGGWAWNECSRKDVDSGALALLVLNRFGYTIPDELLTSVLAAQLPEGGFPTYPADRDGTRRFGWQEGHPEVTACVMEALKRIGIAADRVEAATTWLEAQQSGGVIPSYWWHGRAYGIWVQSRVRFHATEAETTARTLLPGARSAPDLAMLLAAATRTRIDGARVDDARSRLSGAQCRDGSWRCHPTLRVTDPSHRLSEPEAPGRVHADPRRVFSTAHAVAALAQATRYTAGGSAAAPSRQSMVGPTASTISRNRGSSRTTS